MASSLAIGDVISARFPAHDPSGHEQEGYRPAVVVGVPDVLGSPRFPVVVLAPLTTDRGQRWAARSPGLYPRLQKGAANLQSDSICLLDQIRSVGMERLRGYRGTLSGAEYRPISEGLLHMLAESTANARWNYDEEADVLYISAGEPKSADSVDIEDGTFVRYDRDRKQITGVTIVGLRARLQKVLEERMTFDLLTAGGQTTATPIKTGA